MNKRIVYYMQVSLCMEWGSRETFFLMKGVIQGANAPMRFGECLLSPVSLLSGEKLRKCTWEDYSGN